MKAEHHVDPVPADDRGPVRGISQLRAGVTYVRGRFSKLRELARDPHMSAGRILALALSRLSYRQRLAKSLSMPRILHIESTSTCNLHCTICPTGVGTLGRPKDRMSFESFKRLMDEGNDSLSRVVFAGYGEPFINPATYDMIAYARKLHIFTELYSNLLLLDDDDLRRVIDVGLELLVVAVDFAEEGENWRYVHKTGRDVDKVKDRLRRIAALKRELRVSHPILRITYPVTKANEQYLEKARAFAEEVGAEFVPKTVNAIVAGQDQEKMVEEWVSDRHNRYAKPRLGSGHCRWPYVGALVYANGDLSPCCYLARGEHKLGNAVTEGLAATWNGPAYKNFRLKLMTEPESVDHCANCVERFDAI